MRKTVDDRLYDTETAEMVGQYSVSELQPVETLYRTPEGNHFLHFRCDYMPACDRDILVCSDGECIWELSDIGVEDWKKARNGEGVFHYHWLFEDDEYGEYEGDVDEEIIAVACARGNVTVDRFDYPNRVSQMDDGESGYVVGLLDEKEWFQDFKDTCTKTDGMVFLIDREPMDIRAIRYRWGEEIGEVRIPVKKEDVLVEYIDGKRYDMGTAIFKKQSVYKWESLYQTPEGDYFLHFECDRGGPCGRDFACYDGECIVDISPEEADEWSDALDGKGDFHHELLFEREKRVVYRSMLAVMCGPEGIRAESFVCPNAVADMDDGDAEYVKERLANGSGWELDGDGTTVFLLDTWTHAVRVIR